MSKKPISSFKKCATAASLAPLAAQGASPPLRSAFLQAARQRKVSSSALAMLSWVSAVRSSSGAGLGRRSGQVSAYWMGMRMSGTPSWAMMEWSATARPSG